ncbi:MAG: fibronectin type III domain-containing protein [Chthoniobacteraceae bacterium]
MERFLRHLTRLLAAGAIAGLALTCADAAEKKDTRPVLDPPPPALPQSVTVARGQRVDVPLKIYGVQSEALRYLIKTPPAHGKLSDLRAVSREAYLVTYEPPADLKVTADRFTFSVQNHAGVSAPVEVTISILDEPARLAIPHTVEYAELLAGATAMKEIEVANKGGGRIEGDLEVDPPFKVEGRSHYRLEAGDYTYFKIVFAPSEGGLFRREIRYTSDREFVTTLVGSAQTPISAEPSRIELRHGAASAVRTGAFEIVNRTGDPLTFKLSGGSRLQVPASISVAAHGRAVIAVSTRADDVTELEDEVRIESPGFALRVPVRAFKAGPMLRLAQQSLALGRIDATRGARASVELENVGGTTASVTAEIAPPFALSETIFDVLPGEKKRLTLIVPPGDAQRYRTWLKFKAGATNVELEVEAELFGGMSSSRAAREEDPETKRPARPKDPAELEPWMPDLNLAKDIRVTNITPTSANLQWPVDMNGAAKFRVDRLVLTRDSAMELRNAWLEIPKTTFTRQGPLWVASVTGLQPQQSQTVRIVPLNPEGRAGSELFRIDFYTVPKRTIPKPSLFSSLFVVLFAIGGFILFRRIRRQFSEPISGF